MGLMPGDTSGEESTVFCSGTLSLLSAEDVSVDFAILKNARSVKKLLVRTKH